MSDKNRNRSSSYNSDENWNDKQEGRYDQQQHNQYGQAQYGDVNYNRDKDRERNRYSGSNYGNYSGSNYGNTASGQQSNYDQDYGSDYNRRNYGNQDQWNQTSNNNSYGRRDHDEPGYDNNRNRNYSGGYGSSENYGSGYSGSNYGNFDRSRNSYNDEQHYGNANRNRDYGNNYNSQNRGNWGNRHEDRDWWDKTRDEVSSWFGDSDAERRRRVDRAVSGAHKGKGPRDYKRSDERILEDVCDRLSDDSFIDASDVDVKVSGTEVMLTGTVESREAKRRAEDLAESISGVTNVQNNLKVKNSSDNSGLRSTYDSGR